MRNDKLNTRLWTKWQKEFNLYNAYQEELNNDKENRESGDILQFNQETKTDISLNESRMAILMDRVA